MKKPTDELKKLQLIAGLINEVEYNESLWGIDKLPLNEAKEAKKKILHIDVANPYEYRHGLAHELDTLGEYTDEALEKAKVTVLKNLAKDANFYSNLLNQQQSPYEFKQTETDKKGMQARPDGHMKKEAKKDEKANVKDNLGKKEEGKKKPKGVKEMPDKGVEGKEKTIKEGVEEGSFMGGVDLGGSFDKMKSSMGDEAKFEDLMKKYDWYAEMSDDSRKWDAQQAMERELKMLSKSIGAEKATEIWNRHAPEDRKIQASFFMRESKISKIKEVLKNKLKEAVKYSIGGSRTKDTKYRRATDLGLEDELKQAGVQFRKDNI